MSDFSAGGTIPISVVLNHEYCEQCEQLQPAPGFKSGVVDGKYVSRRCAGCFEPHERFRGANDAAYNLEREREDSARDIIQPFLGDGVTPNPDFAHAYPIKAKELYYTKEQLEDL